MKVTKFTIWTHGMTKCLFLLGCLLSLVNCRKHHLQLENDERRLIHISTFGYLKGGSMDVKLKFFTRNPVGPERVGFTVDRTLNNGINPYSPNMDDKCPDALSNTNDESIAKITFTMDFEKNVVKVDCSPDLVTNVRVCHNVSCVPRRPKIRPEFAIPNVMPQRQRRGADNFPVEDGQKMSSKPSGGFASIDEIPLPKNDDPNASIMTKDAASITLPKDITTDLRGNTCKDRKLPLTSTKLSNKDGYSYSFNFAVYIAAEVVEGLYSLYFHNCAPEDRSSVVTLDIEVVEVNQDDSEDGHNYLSAGETPLPALYLMMSVLFFIAGCFWILILRKSSRENGVTVFKLHYLMASLVFVKSLSLMFHSINYHYIQKSGYHVEAWAVLYYITHLLKGALLFLTILLIGTGYAFVKHLLSEKEKKVFIFVIPLQVLANIAQIIIEESEEGQIVHTTWRVIFISVDLLCCGAILFPVVWSIRHLQEASQTDGKAASSLKKLKLFRHFYIMIVTYVYFTRVIDQMLLRITVPFQYQWVDDMFLEMTTFIFFVLTGYKFRPTRNNPYLEVGNDSDAEDMDTALTESGLTEGLSKRGYRPRKKTLKEIVLFNPNEDGSDSDEEVLLEKRESSHDFD